MASSEIINMTASSVRTEIYHLSKIASKIALQYFEWRFITLVYLNSTLFNGAEIFLQTYKKIVVIGSGTFYPKYVDKTRQYVLFGNSVTDVVDTLRWMRAHEFDNTGKYIIVCQSLNKQDCDEAVAVQALWNYKITNVVLLKIVENEATVFTYFPLFDENCTYDEPVRIENLSSCLGAIDMNESCNLFPMKLDNLNACPLIVSTFLQPPYMKIKNGIPSGADGDLLMLLAEKLNGSLTVMTPAIGNGWGKMENNGTWSGSLADIYIELANFSITSAALTLARFSYFQLSLAYNSASVVWVTHSAKKIPSSVKLTYPFQQDAQIALVISFSIVIICAVIIRSRFWFKISRKINMKRPDTGIVFHSWMICMGLGLPATRMPTKTALLYIVLLWIWYSMLVRTLYQVSLISAMKATYYYRDLETIEDFLEAEYTFGGGNALKDYFIDYPKVYDRWKAVETLDIIPTLRNVSKGMEFVIAMNMQTVKTIVGNEKLHVHILSQRVITSPTVVFFKKYSPLLDAVNSVLARLIEAGFSEKSHKNYVTKEHSAKPEHSIEAITLDHYTGCYVLLMMGWIVSYLLFVSEILFNKIQKKMTL